MNNIDPFEELKEINQKEEKMAYCESCGRSIRNNKWKKQHHHINICQQPIKRFFCSRQCKLKWIFKKVKV
ncbi:MAG: hypothetical protein KAV01_07300 [Candidatus Lokiarchaeota archaeon]|nr:hypothetical protein [Candidatus Lokiarchaeota archaeon]